MLGQVQKYMKTSPTRNFRVRRDSRFQSDGCSEKLRGQSLNFREAQHSTAKRKAVPTSSETPAPLLKSWMAFLVSFGTQAWGRSRKELPRHGAQATAAITSIPGNLHAAHQDLQLLHLAGRRSMPVPAGPGWSLLVPAGPCWSRLVPAPSIAVHGSTAPRDEDPA